MQSTRLLSVIVDVGRFGMSVVGALDVAVSGCREPETDVVDMFVHQGVRINVVRVGAMVKWLVKELECANLKSAGRSLLKVNVGAEGLLESVPAGMACLWVVVVSSVDEDVGGIVGVVSVADGMSELSSAVQCWCWRMARRGGLGSGRWRQPVAASSWVGVVREQMLSSVWSPGLVGSRALPGISRRGGLGVGMCGICRGVGVDVGAATGRRPCSRCPETCSRGSR